MTSARSTEPRVSRSRLQRPRLPVDLIDRPRLLACLDESARLKMTLVWAPAGYGKSTLVGSWLAAGCHRATWLALEEHDDTAAAFVRVLVAAIQVAIPDAGRTTLALLNLPEPASPLALATALADELGALSEPLVVVLDDYERVRAAPIHELLSDLLLRLPERLHVVVVSRAVPPLPLATLRAQGQLAEIDADHLKFSRDEAQAFLDRALGEHMPAETVAFLEERTEGWPAGLRLAAVLLRERPDRGAVLDALDGGSHAYVREYLLDEMLAGQPAEVRQFLLQTSILDRFRGSLCSAVVEGQSVE